MLQLPPAERRLDLKQLLDEHGKPVDEAWKARRRDALLDAFRASFAPDVLLIELFPVRPAPDALRAAAAARRGATATSAGRLLGARPDPAAPGARGRDARDASSATSTACWCTATRASPRSSAASPKAARLAGKLHYTGYVVDEDRSERRRGQPARCWSRPAAARSAGGCSKTALEARALTALRDRAVAHARRDQFAGTGSLAGRAPAKA